MNGGLLFPVLVVDMRIEGSPKMKWLNPNDRKFIKSVHEGYLAPIDKINYFEQESGFNIIGFLMGGNGTIILMGLVFILCFKGMGKLNESQMAPNAFENQRPSVASRSPGRKAD